MLQLKFYLFVIAFFLFNYNSFAQSATTRIFVVRHADRLPTDDLNELGVVRANELKRTLLSTGIDSIFSTNFVRTKKTVTPLADALKLPVIRYDNDTVLVKRILQNSAGKTFLVAGHSNTVPEIIELCGCKPPFDIVPDTQFDNLFLVIIENKGTNSCKLLHMKFGAVTN